MGIQVTRNSTTADTANTVLSNEVSPQAPDAGSSLNMGVSSSEFVALNAGDVLRVFVLQRNRGGNDVPLGTSDRPFDLTYAVVWTDTL